MDYKSRVGETSATYRDTITEDQVAQFRRGIAGSARRHGLPVTILAAFREGEKEFSRRLGFELNRMLHGQQEYEFLGQIPVGTEFEYQSRLLNVLEKRGRESRGGMLIYTVGTEYRLEDRVFATSKATVIYRSEARA